jgi:tetratricopeptide (TPR) repeat protein
MRFRCEQCGTEYSLLDEGVARASRARCPRCKHSQALHPDIPLATPPGGKSQIGRVALTSRTIQQIPDPPPPDEEELFGELEWETDTPLDFVVGQGNIPFDDAVPAPPSIPPVSPPGVVPPGPLMGQSSAPIDWTEVRAEYEAAVARDASERAQPEADEWPESESTNPWRRTPLPALDQPLSPARAAPPPASPSAAEPSGPPPGVPLRTPGRQPPPPTAAAAPGTPPTGTATPPAVPGIPLSTPPTQPGTPVTTPPAPGAAPPDRPAAPVTPASRRAAPDEPCAACGGRLVDADDLASGVCGACRARTAAALGRTPAMAARQPTPDSLEVAPRAPTPPLVRRRTFRAMLERQRRGRMWVLLGLLGVAAGLAALAWYLRVRPDPVDLQQRVAAVIPRPTKRKTPVETRLPEGLEVRLASWKKPPAETRGLAELLVGAQVDLARDTEASDLAAERAMQTALLEDPHQVEALGLWMESVAHGRGSQLPASEVDSLVLLGESALERVGNKPSIQVGLASLLLVRGKQADVERARAVAQLAVDASRPPAPPAPAPPLEPAPLWGTRARLVLAEAYAVSSARLALSLLDEVQTRDPGQRRVFNVRAAAHEAVGSPKAAVADLQRRLAVDVDEPRTSRALAKLLGQVGETAQARKIYERLQSNPATQDGPAVIDLAALRAEAEHAPAEAAKLLTHALGRGRLTGAELLRAQICLARVARAAADLPLAVQAATAALAIAPEDPQAHLQALLIDLDRGAPEQAAAHLSPVLDRVGDAGLAALIEGKVRAAQQRWQAAAEAFDRAAAADPRRTDAQLWAGAAWAMTGGRDRALQSAAPALQADPFRDGPGVPPLWPGDGLRSAAERLALLSRDDRDGTPLLAEAVLRVHQGDTASAEALINRILKAGGDQALVLGWKSIILGARGDSAGALTQAKEAVASGGRTSGFAQFALGSALLATGDLEGAQRSLREAQTQIPGLLAAQVRLAEAEARVGAIVSARERLQRVIVLDPEYASARRALYLLPPEG